MSDFYNRDLLAESNDPDVLSSHHHSVSEDMANVSRRILAPARFTHTFYVDTNLKLPAVVALSCELVATSGFVITNLSVTPRPGGDPITSQLLRKIQVSALLESATRTHLILHSRTQSSVANTSTSRAFDDFEALRAELKSAGPSSPETLEWASLVYEVASIEGDKPTLAVSQAFEISLRTASNWVRTAREKGFLENG